MHVLWNELSGVRAWALLIESAGGLIVASYCAAGFAVLCLHLDRARAQRLVAQGALAALNLMVCATLLKTLLLTSWQQIGMFATVLALRTGLKRIFTGETRAQRPGPAAA